MNLSRLPEHHLFLLWEKAGSVKDRVIRDLKKRFTVLQVAEIHWDRRNFLRNLIRFYGDTPLILRYKRWHCGSGPMVLVVVRDRRPCYQNRNTTKGLKQVNVNIFDTKDLYRQWSGGGHRVHATNSPKEFYFDYTLVTGQDVRQVSGLTEWGGENIQTVTSLAGENGWDSLRHLFDVLNAVTRYVVLRNYDYLPDDHVVDSHGDIDLLTDDIQLMKRVSNARVSRRLGNRVLHKVKINGQMVPIDFRHVGDSYYDRQWEEDMLESRKLHDRGFYVPSPIDHWYGLLYHAAVHKHVFSDKYIPRLLELKKKLNINGVDQSVFSDLSGKKKVLDDFLATRNYRYSDPQDLSVHYNLRFSGKHSKRIMRWYVIPAFRALKNCFRKP